MNHWYRLSEPFQLSLSTAEDEVNYFTAPPLPVYIQEPSTALQQGTYRVIDGQLHLVVPGVPPSLRPGTSAAGS